mgnify:CR=1 FL=1
MNARILVIDDNDTLREGVVAVCERLGHDVRQANSGDAGVKMVADAVPDLVLTDLKMDGLDGLGVLDYVKTNHPEVAVMIITAYATVETAVKAIKMGAFDYIEKPFSTDALRIKAERALEWRALQQKNERLSAANEVLSGQREPEQGGFHGMVGSSPAMERIFKMIERVAATDTNVHIYGESGTGKELVASAVHKMSARKDGPLIKVNCGAIPENLMESEFFGHEKGAFTGAEKQKLGRFELADGGTLFFDVLA